MGGSPQWVFLSTFPLRGTSRASWYSPTQASNFYPRSPCGERPGGRDKGGYMTAFLSTFPLRGTSLRAVRSLRCRKISIHVPLAGNVARRRPNYQKPQYFYPRSPCGERHVRDDFKYFRVDISIHVPLAGNVSTRLLARSPLVTDFYPRSPCGERLSLRRAAVRRCGISIHVPLAGNVSPIMYGDVLSAIFLSTFPLRGTSAACPTAS